MENEHSETVAYKFLEDRLVKSVFSKIDYALRSGVHIQREYPGPEQIFLFIEKYYESLAQYYNDIYRLVLEKTGEDYYNRYYFLDFESEQNRSALPSDNKFRRLMETEHIIVGMLFLKIFKLDANFELDSVQEFIQLLFTEYEEQKNGLFKLIVGAKSDKVTDYLEQDAVKQIYNAFSEFEKLGWIIYLNDERIHFKVMPSFERLRKKYEAQILTIEEIINDINDEG
ncbi:condensin complex protein MksE [Sphingobacterium anhuiense]|uniref:condensin complex protein MksE n=1 Tax=Sphingobacterium anhuiense TaxID=493780 RepID=UPI003C2D109F